MRSLEAADVTGGAPGVVVKVAEALVGDGDELERVASAQKEVVAEDGIASHGFVPLNPPQHADVLTGLVWHQSVAVLY